jgi:iron complex transport system ATP-binding protein
MGKMLKLENISFQIGKKKILNDVNITFQPGKFSMILGPNGSGKSSLLKIFSGSERNFKGKVYYNGVDLATISNETLAKKRAVLSQQSQLQFPLQVKDVVMMGRYPHFSFQPLKQDQEICMEVIATMQLHHLQNRNYLSLSGGEKQRVHFARILAQLWTIPEQDSRYLFLDEPLNSLDIHFQQEFLQIAKSFLGPLTVLVAIIHDINLALRYSDQLSFLKDGEIIATGTPNEMVTPEIIEHVFSVKSAVMKHPFGDYPLVLIRN